MNAEAPVQAPWWTRAGLGYDKSGRLRFAGESVGDLAARHGTPLYVYSADRVSENVARLRAALAATGLSWRLLYAMKANRFAPLLRHVHDLGLGLDVCSPGEVRHALACGFAIDRLSFTAGSLSTADYAALAAWPALWVNADSLASLRRLAAASPCRELGLRVNPALGLGYSDNPLLRYSGAARPTKFGIYADRFAEALDLAGRLQLCVTGLHCHAGSGYLAPQLSALDQVFARIGSFLDAAPQIRRLNLGGGLGVPLVASDTPLDLAAWAGLVRRHFGHRELSITLEPGDYLVKDAGLLLAEVTQIEAKGDRIFVGVNAGFNVHPEPAFYRLPLEPAPALLRPSRPSRVTIAGNINEALDLWAEDVALPPLEERDILAFLNAGAYGASMASRHCLRDEFKEHLVKATASADTLVTLDIANRNAWDSLYASTPELVWGRETLPFLDAYREELRAAPSAAPRLLDAGAGEGRNLPFLLSFADAEVHAIDASAHALAKIPEELRARVRLRQTALDATGFPDASFDAITVLDVIETLPDSGRVLRELARVLKPGGLLLCNIPGHDDGVAGIDMRALNGDSYLYRGRYFYRFLERDDAEKLLAAAGLELIRADRREWREDMHPGFRPEPHHHVSHVFLARRPAPPARRS